MSRLLILLLVIAPLGLCQGLETVPVAKDQKTDPDKAGRLTCADPSWDFGLAPQFQTLKHSYVLKNEGRGVLNILRVVPQCQCAAGLPDKRNLQPGETTEIAATMRTLTFEGRVTKTITVVTDDPVTPNYKLTVTGLVAPPYSIVPKEVHLGSVGKRDETELRPLKVIVTKGMPINVLEVKASDPHVICELAGEPKALENGSVEHVFNVKMLPGLPVGHVRETLTVITDDTNKRTTVIPVIASVTGEVTVSPRTFNLGKVKAGTSVSRELEVVKSGKGDLQIDKVKVDMPSVFDASLVEVEKGRKYKVVVSLHGDAKPGYHRGRVSIRTNVEGEVMHQAYFYAYVIR